MLDPNNRTEMIVSEHTSPCCALKCERDGMRDGRRDGKGFLRNRPAALLLPRAVPTGKSPSRSGRQVLPVLDGTDADDVADAARVIRVIGDARRDRD